MAGREHLAALGVPEPGASAEVLLRHALGWSRTDLYLHWHRPLDPAAWPRYEALLAERARGRPVAYIVGRREFWGLEFLVDERVLIPRPETELLVDVVLAALAGQAAPLVADIGTGSGAIAVSLAVARPDALVFATDISPGALEVARTNAARHGVGGRVRFLCGDLVEPLAASSVRLDALACNPPYVDPATAATLPVEIRNFEPREAVVAPEGVSVHRRLVAQSPRVLRPGGLLAMEVAAGQAAQVVELLERAARYVQIATHRDLAGWERVVSARLRAADDDRCAITS
ncbi:MAG: peptide chain release factor N(5)-glutamine methyltransferase [Armatimonadota bacterium]|nr:peptide chain release factor N(5)-glutamine methyltransferase [Armatimonadota bacterium]MDR7485008.1 peptide chain release factor N(5)-glutamine methyltransferase [Armatimonadota bacterium]MDR7533691.1 peptide chain release factor N(5)-glutamine methyltransferase [Armatimonadota bacterium]MDR7535522.1 peptide chain release factor N(5)-glutamine methyltransferase [Armatimonadota bacterium]